MQRISRTRCVSGKIMASWERAWRPQIFWIFPLLARRPSRLSRHTSRSIEVGWVHGAIAALRFLAIEKHSNRNARICWHTIFISGKPQWYSKSLKQRGLLSHQADIRRVAGARSYIDSTTDEGLCVGVGPLHRSEGVPTQVQTRARTRGSSAPSLI